VRDVEAEEENSKEKEQKKQKNGVLRENV